MRFAKSFYRVDVVVKTPVTEYGGYQEPYEFMSAGSCMEHITASGLDMVWPEGQGIPITQGFCTPQCFCEIYRRQALRRLKRGDILGFNAVCWYGFERMRRSVAESRLIEAGKHIPSRKEDPDYIPRGYFFAAIIEFIRSFRK